VPDALSVVPAAAKPVGPIPAMLVELRPLLVLAQKPTDEPEYSAWLSRLE
jgi:hypothetical protein